MVVLAIVGVAVQLAPATPAQEPQASDPVITSFERVLSHEPGPPAPVRGESIEHDELYEVLNRVHWKQDDTAVLSDATLTNTKGGADDEEDER